MSLFPKRPPASTASAPALDTIHAENAMPEVDPVDAPATAATFLMCAFAAVGGLFYGYDTGYVNGIIGMKYFIHAFTSLPYPPETPEDVFTVSSSRKSLIVSILSAGTFVGALAAGDLADLFGRRTILIAGCVVFSVGCVLQTAASTYGLLAAGRRVSGIGVGFVSTTIILYMSEVAPQKIRGAIISCYQFFITVGLLTAACVTYGTETMTNSGSYRIPIALQLAWAIILGCGFLFHPETPRFYVKKDRLNKAATVLAHLRRQPVDSATLLRELSEIRANYELEVRLTGETSKGYFHSWASCFTGSVANPASNLRRTILSNVL